MADFPKDLLLAVDGPGGDPALRCLSLLHGAAVIGRFDAVQALAAHALTLGLPTAKLAAAGLQVAPYGGFPRAIETLSLIAEAQRASGPASTDSGSNPGRIRPNAPQEEALQSQATPSADSSLDRLRVAGLEVFRMVYGDNTEAVLEQLATLHADLPSHVLEAAYGKVLSQPGLSLGERELLAVSALALAALPAPLGSHIRGALRNGFTSAAVEDILHASTSLADKSALPVIDQALDRLSRKVYRP